MVVNRQMLYFQQFIHMSARSALPLALARTSVNCKRIRDATLHTFIYHYIFAAKSKSLII